MIAAMQLDSLLRRDHIIVPLVAPSTRAAIEAMLQHLIQVGTVRDDGAFARLVAEANSRGIVPIRPRVALAHMRTEAVDELVLALGVAPHAPGPGAAGLDAAPGVVVLLLAPPGASTLYLQVVSTLARVLHDEALADRLANARSAEDVLALTELRSAAIPRRLTVGDLMGQRSSVGPDSSVRDAVDLMIRDRIKALPVVGEKGEVLGIVTEWDVMRAVLPQVPVSEQATETSRSVPKRLVVRDIMTRSVLCISEEMGLDEVANMMVNKHVEQFPVVGDGVLKGFLSRGDIIRKLFGK